MKKVMLFVMVCCLVGLAQAELAVTNGDFETDAPGGSVPDVPHWYDNSTANFWEDAWISDVGTITPNGTNVVVFCSWDTVAGESLTGSYLYQSIGTAEGMSLVEISFDWGHPDDVGAGRIDGITVSVLASDGTFVADDATDVLGAAGVTVLDSASFDHAAEGTDGEIFSVAPQLDISGAGTQELFLRFNNYQPTGGGDPWPVLDNIQIQIVKTDFASGPDPGHGDTNVAVDLSDRKIADHFSWSAPEDPNIAVIKGYDLYLDPNETYVANRNVSECDIVDSTAAGVTQYDPASNLNFETPYYWTVDTRYTRDDDPNLGTPDETIYVGSPSVWNFTTAPEVPLVTSDPDPYTAVDAGEPNVILSVTILNAGSYLWYKEGTGALSNGTDYTGVDTATLTINDVQLADEGYYYCVGTNLAGTDTSASGRVMIKRLTSHYPFETTSVVDSNTITPDIEDGFDAVFMQEAASAGMPVLADANSIVGKYIQFDNTDHATDPNGQYTQMPEGVVSYEDITIAAWIHWTGGESWQRVYDFGSSESAYMFLTPSEGLVMRFAISTSGWGGEQRLEAATLPIGEWTYVTVTLNGDTARLYVNGELVDTNSDATLNPIDVNPVSNYLANSQFAVDPEFNGLIDELKIYNYALTTEQIGQDYIGVMGGTVCNYELYDLVYDFNGDCIVNLSDFAMFVTEWLNDYIITAP